MSEALTTRIERGLEAVNRLEAKVNGEVRCCDCSYKSKIEKLNEMGDGGCPENSNHRLVGAFMNGKSLRQPRKCLGYQPNGKEKTN